MCQQACQIYNYPWYNIKKYSKKKYDKKYIQFLVASFWFAVLSDGDDRRQQSLLNTVKKYTEEYSKNKTKNPRKNVSTLFQKHCNNFVLSFFRTRTKLSLLYTLEREATSLINVLPPMAGVSLWWSSSWTCLHLEMGLRRLCNGAQEIEVLKLFVLG